MNELGVTSAQIMRVNLAIVMLEQGRAGVASHVERAMRAFEASGQRAMIGIAHLLMAARLRAGRRRGRPPQRGLRHPGPHFVEQDIALIAQSAASLAEHTGWVDRARGAWVLARSQWRARPPRRTRRRRAAPLPTLTPSPFRYQTSHVRAPPPCS